MKILLTNDDGIDAAGLDALFKSVSQTFGHSARVVVVAPDRGRSECGHSVTTGRPLKFQQRKADWFAVDGTPVDCVRAALASLAPDVDLVVSGVNAGANLGIDLLVSGTFAAAREAALHGIPAMAVSHYRRPDVPVTWDHVPDWLAETLREFAGTVASGCKHRQAGIVERQPAGNRSVVASATESQVCCRFSAIGAESKKRGKNALLGV